MLGLGKKVHTGVSRRQNERFAAMELACAIGPLVDLSASGMRIRCQGKPHLSPGQTQHFVLRSPSQALHLSGRLVRARRVDLLGREYDVGVEFVDMTPAKRAAVAQLAQYGFIAAGKHRADSEAEDRHVTASIEVENLYAILGVDPEATREEIHAAYRRLALDCHPDVSQEPDAVERFAEISKVYRILSDEGARKRYDAMLRATMRAA